MSRTALVTGGAGYIGSHCALYLQEAGWDVVVIDNLSTGHEEAVLGGAFYGGDVGDEAALDEVFSSHSIDAVIHFAASLLVSESVSNPSKYYRNNVVNGFTLLQAMLRHGVDNLVFSSSAAVYGEPDRTPIEEGHATAPINPYGMTKLVFERMALDMARASKLRPVFLRYFNAAGADPEGRLGEEHDPETHLVPIVVNAALGLGGPVSVFGDDYPTADGTCVRDYIHVYDLADAHIRALEYLEKDGAPGAFNLGNGAGYSVSQVIAAVSAVSGVKVPYKIAPRREGDPAALVASSGKARAVLGVNPEYPNIESIVETTLNWRKANPGGFNGAKG